VFVVSGAVNATQEFPLTPSTINTSKISSVIGSKITESFSSKSVNWVLKPAIGWCFFGERRFRACGDVARLLWTFGGSR
jgi:hypothetical protein